MRTSTPRQPLLTFCFLSPCISWEALVLESWALQEVGRHILYELAPQRMACRPAVALPGSLLDVQNLGPPRPAASESAGESHPCGSCRSTGFRTQHPQEVGQLLPQTSPWLSFKRALGGVAGQGTNQLRAVPSRGLCGCVALFCLLRRDAYGGW